MNHSKFQVLFESFKTDITNLNEVLRVVEISECCEKFSTFRLKRFGGGRGRLFDRRLFGIRKHLIGHVLLQMNIF